MKREMSLERAGVLVREALANGGFTYAVEQGKMINPAQLAHGSCAVSLPGFECRVPIINATSWGGVAYQYVAATLVEWARLVECVRNYNGAHLGGWVEPVADAKPDALVSAYLVLDITVLVKREDAVAQCVAWNQRAYYDFERGQTVYVNVSGR